MNQPPSTEREPLCPVRTNCVPQYSSVQIGISPLESPVTTTNDVIMISSDDESDGDEDQDENGWGNDKTLPSTGEIAESLMSAHDIRKSIGKQAESTLSHS